MFQIFVSDSSSSAFPPCVDVDSTVQDMITRIGMHGDARHKLGFFVGPISFNQSDEDVRRMIAQSFQIARKRNVAVGFHLDDHMFWDKRTDLIKDNANIEWVDWQGTLSMHRRLDWGPAPTKVGPQMCFNSVGIKNAVHQRAHLIATEIRHEWDRLTTEHREDLFAGIIIGWETQIGREFSTNRPVGYHALSNAGFSARSAAAESDARLVKIVQSFMEMWAVSLSQAGIPSEKLFCHIAFTPQGFASDDGLSALQKEGFSQPSVAFSTVYRPGFSTYPFADTLEQISQEVATHGNPPWGSCEGTNVVPNGMPGERTMETYLAKMFNHGAVLVNIFSWGIGGEAQREKNMFRRATENQEALLAYRKFLSGGALKEEPRSTNAFSPQRLQQKVHTIQAQVPLFVQRTHRPDLIQSLTKKLDAAIKANRFEDADKAADQVLKLIDAK
jgi:hypothetical protein